MGLMIRHLHRHKFRWYILATLVLATYPLVVSITVLAASLGSLLTGTQELQQAKSLLLSDPPEARRYFQSASASLEQSVTLLQQAPWYTQLLTPLPPFRWQVQLTKASHALAESGTIATSLSQSFPELSKSSDPNALLSQASTQFFQWYDANTDTLNLLQGYLSTADDTLRDVPNWIIPGHLSDFYSLKQQVTTVSTTLPRIRRLVDNLETAFGSHDVLPHNFLVVYQNDSELRASGGFMGSYATLTTSSGRIRQYSFGKDIYQIDDNSTGILPPEQLATITQTWTFKDSNVGAPGFIQDYSPQIKRFFDLDTNKKIEGIIYLNVSVLEALMKITGPLVLPGTSTEVTADTVSTSLTKYVEKDYFQSDSNKVIDQPKSILNDLIPVLIAKIHTTNHVISSLLPALRSEFSGKAIQFWSTNQSLESSLTDFLPLDAPLPTNWMKIVNSNLGGVKSSAHVLQDVAISTRPNFFSHTTTYDVNITRTHNGNGAWPDGENKNFMEIYLPPSATILTKPDGIGGTSSLDAHGQELLGTTNKVWNTQVSDNPTWKRVSFWATTEIDGKTEYHLVYTIPTTQASTFTYLKQAGSQNENLIWNGTYYPVAANITLNP